MGRVLCLYLGRLKGEFMLSVPRAEGTPCLCSMWAAVFIAQGGLVPGLTWTQTQDLQLPAQLALASGLPATRPWPRPEMLLFLLLPCNCVPHQSSLPGCGPLKSCVRSQIRSAKINTLTSFDAMVASSNLATR